MSRNTSSSAPWLSYRAAASTGSPASRRERKLVPFTTRPSFMSRQGIIRFAYIFSPPALSAFLYVSGEVPQYGKAHAAALFRVELAGGYVPLLHRRVYSRAVLRRGRDQFRLRLQII